MNANQLRILAAISAVNARIEGMKTYNRACELSGSDRLYDETVFLQAANELESLSIEAANS